MKNRHMLRQYSMFLAGVMLCSVGIAFVTRAGLGTSPISSIPFILSLVTPPQLTTGVFTMFFNMVFLILEALLMRRFTLQQALQVPVALVFSLLIDLAMHHIPSRYGGPWSASLIYLLWGCLLMALGICFEVMADVIMLPGEAFVRSLSQRLHRSFGNVKICFDSSLSAVAIGLAFLFFGTLNGVREGTLINALLVGQLVKLLTPRLQGLKQLWLGERRTDSTISV